MQALATLNDEVYFEAAQHLALRVLREAPDNDEERLHHAFRLCLSRSPDQVEAELLRKTLEEQLQIYEADHESAKTLLLSSSPAGLAPEQYAAWVGVARVLLNLDETITRE